MRIERHVFGSYSGYATLARSAGLTADDVRQLEASSYGFGQTSDRGYLKGLRRNPAWFTRLLRGRRGLTRVLEGPPDDNGRPTLLLITAVLTQRDWDSELCGDVGLLLDDSPLWDYDGNAELAAIDRAYPLPTRGPARKSLPKLLALVSELERRLGSRQPIVVSAADFSPDDLRVLEALVPPAVRGSFTCSCRSLSVNLPVNVNCVAEESETQGANFRPETGAALSGYAAFLQTTTLAAGGLPLSEVMGYQSFGRREQGVIGGELMEAPMAAPMTAATASPGASPVATRSVPAGRGYQPHRTSPMLVALLLLLCVLMSVAGFMLGRAVGLKGTQANAAPAGRTSPGPGGGPAPDLLDVPISNPASVPNSGHSPPATAPPTTPAQIPTPPVRADGTHSNDSSDFVRADGDPPARGNPSEGGSVTRRSDGPRESKPPGRDGPNKHQQKEEAIEAARKQAREEQAAQDKTQYDLDLAEAKTKLADDLNKLHDARLKLVLGESERVLKDVHSADRLTEVTDRIKQYADAAAEDAAYLVKVPADMKKRIDALAEACSVSAALREIRNHDKEITTTRIKFGNVPPLEMKGLFDLIEKKTADLEKEVKGLPEKAACLPDDAFTRFKSDHLANVEDHKSWLETNREKAQGKGQTTARKP